MKTLQECKEEAAKQWFFETLGIVGDYRTLSNGVKVGNIKQRNLETVLEKAAELYASQFKPPVYGQTAEELTGDEINALRSVGIIAENWYAVSYNSNSMPYAIFQNEDYAKAYRDRFSATSIVDPWPMKIKDYRKKALPPSPGSVDVEEKKECQHEALTDTGVGYHHCPTCNASFKVDGLGDSSGSVSGIAMQKAIEFVRTYPTGNTFDYRIGFEAGHEFAISKESVKEVSRDGDNEAIQNLLATLHRDGGHYTGKHGLLKSIQDAQELLHKEWVLPENISEVSREGEIAELHEKLEEITFYEEEARRQIGIRDQLLEDIFYNRLKPEVIKQKIDDILNLPF